MQRTWLKVGEPFFTPFQLGRAGNYFSSLSKKHCTFGWHDNDIRALLGSFWGSWKVKAFQLKTESILYTLIKNKGSHVGKSTIRICFIQNWYYTAFPEQKWKHKIMPQTQVVCLESTVGSEGKILSIYSLWRFSQNQTMKKQKTPRNIFYR